MADDMIRISPYKEAELTSLHRHCVSLINYATALRSDLEYVAGATKATRIGQDYHLSRDQMRKLERVAHIAGRAREGRADVLSYELKGVKAKAAKIARWAVDYREALAGPDPELVDIARDLAKAVGLEVREAGDDD